MSHSIKEIQPSKLLQPYIQCYWFGEFNTDGIFDCNQHVRPNGFVELIIHLTDDHCFLIEYQNWVKSPVYTLIGLFTVPYTVKFNKKVSVFGVRIKPEAVHNLFGIPATEFSEIHIDAKDVIGLSLDTFSRKINNAEGEDKKIEAANLFFRKILVEQEIEYYYLNHAAELIRNSKGIFRLENLTDDMWISPRQLEREFKQKIGLTPKQYSRMIRFNEANKLIEAMDKNGMDLQDITHSLGFTDQSHFIREFKKFVGMTPVNLVKNENDFISVFRS